MGEKQVVLALNDANYRLDIKEQLTSIAATWALAILWRTREPITRPLQIQESSFQQPLPVTVASEPVPTGPLRTESRSSDRIPFWSERTTRPPQLLFISDIGQLQPGSYEPS
jgi:hypothetical protein